MARILEPLYRPESEYQKLIENYQTQLTFEEERPAQILLHRKIVTVHRNHSLDFRSAFYHLGQAFLVDFGNEEIDRELNELAEKEKFWDGLLSFYLDGLDLNQESGLQEIYWFKIATLYERKLGKAEKAEQFYQKVLSLNPKHRESIEATRALL